MKEKLDPLFYKFIVENLHGDVAILDADFKYLFINPYAMKSAEMRQWIVGKTDVEYCAFKGIDLSIGLNRLAKLKLALESKMEVAWEECLPDADGNNKYFLRRVSPLFDEGGNNLLYFIGHGIEITPMQKIRHELEANKKITDAILNGSPNSIFIKNSDGEFIIVNKAVADLFQTTPENLINKHNLEVHKNQLEAKRYLEIDDEVIRSRKMKRIEETFSRPDGSIVWFDTVKVPIVLEEGKVSVLGISTDITDRKLKEDLLKESERQLMESQLITKSGSWYLHLVDNRMDWSLGLNAIFSLENAVKNPDFDMFISFIHPNDVQFLLGDFEVLKSEKSERISEFRIIVNSIVKHVKCFNRAILNSEGDVVTIFGSLIDISDQVLAQEEMVRNEIRFREAQSLAKMGSYDWDYKTGEIVFSRGACEIYEWSYDESAALADEFINMIHPDDKDYYLELWNLLPSRKEDFEIEIRVISAKGNVKWIKSVNNVIVNEQGDIIRLTGSIIDISSQKLVENELRLNEERLNEAQELSKTGSFEYNFNTHEILWSNGMYLIYELEKSIVPTWEIFNAHLHPEDRNKIEEISRTLKVGSPPWTYTFRMFSSSGKLKHIEVRNKFSKTKDGSAITIIGSYIDITDRIEVEEKLRLNDLKLNEVQEIAKIGNFELNLITNEVFYSKSAYQIYEWKDDEQIPNGEQFIEMVHPDDRDYFNELWKLIPSRKGTFESNFRIITKSGVLKYIKTINKLERNSKNEIVGIIGIISDITERKLADELIKKNEVKLIEAQHLSKTGSFELNFKTGELLWSLGMYAIWELDEKVVPTIDLFYSTIHPDDLLKLKLHEQTISADSKPWAQEYRILTKHGNWKYVNTYLKVVKSLTKNEIMVVGSCIDVSESKLAEKRLKLNEAKLLEAERLSNSGSWAVNLYPEFQIEWSPGSFALWDMEIGKDFPTQENFYEHVHKDDQAKVRAAFKNLIEKGEPVELQFKVNTWANKMKVFYSKGLAIKDENGNVVKIFGTNTDVTKRQAEEERIKFSENSLLQAQRIAKLGSFYLDLRTAKFDWTAGVNYIWEMDAGIKQLRFEEFLATIHPDDKAIFNEAISLAAKHGHKQLFEFRIVVGQNKIKNIEARLRVYDYDNGKAIKVFGTVIDITERKFVEQELVRAKKLAEESSKAKELFLANISHELRTPLNGILGMSRLLKKSSLNTVQRNYTEVLHQTAENLLVIISEILDFTKIEEGKLTLEEVTFDPIRVADTSINLQMFKAEEKDILLRHKHIGDIPMPKVIGDPYRLSQILLNLLNNAIKFTNYGEVLLSHAVVFEDFENVEIQFSVKDTGIGIPKSLHHKIFESFTQLEKSGNKNVGVGLGLTISKNLIEKQGGKIWVESAEDIGSTFHFSIKYKKSVDAR
ncbi:MAG: PAS domain-containing protein [Bacteroidetes bacterium]|nr:PAS domain-containing protein [Bacteroidota bacterium]